MSDPKPVLAPLSGLEGITNDSEFGPVARQNSKCSSKVVLREFPDTRWVESPWAQMLSRSQLLLINGEDPTLAQEV
jgi:hypothetical protein